MTAVIFYFLTFLVYIFKGVLKIIQIIKSSTLRNKVILVYFNRWKEILKQFKKEKYISLKSIPNNKNGHVSFLYDRVYYSKMILKSELEIQRKRLKGFKKYALNSLIKSINTICFKNNLNILEIKVRFLKNFVINIKLNNTIKYYGIFYNKLNSFIGTDNHLFKKRSILAVRDSYKKYFLLMKIFIKFEKFNHGFSRYLNYYSNSYANQKNLSNTNKTNSQILENSYNLKFFKLLNFQNPSDETYFNRKRTEAKSFCYPQVYLNICFYKWKQILFMQ